MTTLDVGRAVDRTEPTGREPEVDAIPLVEHRTDHEDDRGEPVQEPGVVVREPDDDRGRRAEADPGGGQRVRGHARARESGDPPRGETARAVGVALFHPSERGHAAHSVARR